MSPRPWIGNIERLWICTWGAPTQRYRRRDKSSRLTSMIRRAGGFFSEIVSPNGVGGGDGNVCAGAGRCPRLPRDLAPLAASTNEPSSPILVPHLLLLSSNENLWFFGYERRNQYGLLSKRKMQKKKNLKIFLSGSILYSRGHK